MTPEQRKQMGREWMLERAAILEFDANLSRKEAERLAVEQWREHILTDPDLEPEREICR
jgi:hypothetical protein